MSEKLTFVFVMTLTSVAGAFGAYYTDDLYYPLLSTFATLSLAFGYMIDTRQRRGRR